MSVEVKQAIRKWIRTEFAFRFGPGAYLSETQTAYLVAEAELRECVTGERLLSFAGKELGCVAPAQRQKTPLPRKRLKRRRLKKSLKSV